MLNKQRLGALQRDFVAAKFLHQIQAEIDRGIDAAAAEKPAVLRHELLGPPVHLGIALTQYVGDAPMGGRLPAVEQSAFSEKRNAGADACNVSAPVVPLLSQGSRWCCVRSDPARPTRSRNE